MRAILGLGTCDFGTFELAILGLCVRFWDLKCVRFWDLKIENLYRFGRGCSIPNNEEVTSAISTFLVRFWDFKIENL